MFTPTVTEFAHAVRLLQIEARDSVLWVTIARPERNNAVDDELHEELIALWQVAEKSPEVRAVHVTGSGRSFCVGGDIDMIDAAASNFDAVVTMQRHATDLARGMIDLSKPIVTAINGPAAGAGLALGLLADVSVIANETIITDGHARLGVVAGDHAALLWPLLCGLNRSKHLLLLSERITGEMAAELGLVSMSVPAAELLSTTASIAHRLAAASPTAIKWTKYTLNHWLRNNWSIFDVSLAYEMLTFFGPDLVEGKSALRERRQPQFGPATPAPTPAE